MPNDHPLGQHVLGGFDGCSVTDEVRDLILKKKILGFTLFNWNIESAAQLCALIDELKSLARQAGYRLILALDQEGGRVARLPVPPFTKIPPMRMWGDLVLETEDFSVIRELGRLVARELRLAGFNLDFAPVADVDLNPNNPVIGDRSFSSDPWHVYQCSKYFLQGMTEEGVMGCLKHFPGHGATDRDSHLELPHDSRPLDVLLAVDILPYGKLIVEGMAPSVMTAHVVYEAIDSKNPATFSHKILGGLLRGQLGYDGVVFSDDLLMKAISDHHDLLDVMLQFFDCGGDAVLVCKNATLNFELVERLEKALLQGSEANKKIFENLRQSQRRLAALKGSHLSLPTEPGDPAEIMENHREFVMRLFPGYK